MIKSDRMALLNRLIRLYHWKPSCIHYIWELCAHPDSYPRRMAEVERRLKASNGSMPEIDPESLDSTCRHLCTEIGGSTPLREVFLQDPALSGLSPAEVGTYCRFADVAPSPDSDTMLRTGDPTFMTVLYHVVRRDPVAPDHWMQDDLVKLLTVRDEFPDACKRISEAVATPEWTEAMLNWEREVETEIRRRTMAPGPGVVAAQGAPSASTANGTDEPAPLSGPDEDWDRFAAVFLAARRFSAMLREEVLLYFGLTEYLPDALSLLSEEFHKVASPEQQYRIVARQVLKWLAAQGAAGDGPDAPGNGAGTPGHGTLPPSGNAVQELVRARQDIELRLQLRIDAAQHFVELRRFAKLDAFGCQWTELARSLQHDRLVIDLESLVNQLDPITPEQEVRWGPFLRDERLSRFLRLRPLFRDIYPDEVTNYAQIAQKVIKGPAVGEIVPGLRRPPVKTLAGSPAVGYRIATLTFSRDPSPDRGQGPADLFAPLETGLAKLVEHVLQDRSETANAIRSHAQRLADAIRQTRDDGDDDRIRAVRMMEFQSLEQLTPPDLGQSLRGLCSTPYHVKWDGGTRQEAGTVEIALAQELAEILSALSRMGPTRMSVPEPSRQLYIDRATSMPERLRQAGGRIFDRFIPSPVQAGLRDTLDKFERLRIVLDLKDAPELAGLPWETLYIAAHGMSVALDQAYSLVRCNAAPPPVVLWGIRPPLRFLVVPSAPAGAPPIRVEDEVQVLEQSLADAKNRGQVDLRILKPVTLDELQRMLRAFKPHLFHFIGHGLFDPQTGQGALACETADKERKTRLVPAEDLRTLLAGNGVQLVVLNARDTGTSTENEAVTSVAGALVDAGVPAVIATTRAVEDQAALVFARELYRSFVDGYPLELAVVEARKALSVEYWDWSVYSLMANTARLDHLRLLSPLSRSDPVG